MEQTEATQRHATHPTGGPFNHKGAVKWKLIQPSICLGEGCSVLATTMRRSATEMGYNLIRMHIMSGHLAVNVRDYHRGWKCCLDVLHSPPSEINSADSHGVPMCGRAPWYWHLSTIVRAALEASPPRVAFMTAQRRDVNHHLSPRHLSPTSNSGAT